MWAGVVKVAKPVLEAGAEMRVSSVPTLPTKYVWVYGETYITLGYEPKILG